MESIEGNKIIVSSKCMKVYLRRIIARWKDNNEKIIMVEYDGLKIPSLASQSYVSGYAKPAQFDTPIMKKPIKKLFELCSLLEDQPVTITFNYNSITVNPVIL